VRHAEIDVEQKEEKVFVISLSDAVIDPVAVMVVPKYAPSACGTMMGPQWFVFHAGRALWIIVTLTDLIPLWWNSAWICMDSAQEGV